MTRTFINARFAKWSLQFLGGRLVHFYVSIVCMYFLRVIDFQLQASSVRFSFVCLLANAVWKCISKRFSWIIKKIIILNQCSKNHPKIAIWEVALFALRSKINVFWIFFERDAGLEGASCMECKNFSMNMSSFSLWAR